MQRIHVWMGTFPSEAAMVRYFEESYSGDDDQPISAFARDQGIAIYDHDWLEFSFSKPEAFWERIRGHGYSEKWYPKVKELATQLRTAGFNALIMVDADEIPAPKSVSQAEYRYHYLGCFDGA